MGSRCRHSDGHNQCCRYVGHAGPHHLHNPITLAPSYGLPHTYSARVYGGINLTCPEGKGLDGVTE